MQDAAFRNLWRDQADLACFSIDRKGLSLIVDQAERMGITSIRVGDGNRSNHTFSAVLIDRVIVEVQICRRLIQIDNVDGEAFRGRQAAFICRRHGQVDHRLSFMIKRDAFRQTEFAINDFEPII